MDTPVTDVSSELTETDKSDKTDAVTNSEFLQAIFGSADESNRPILVTFPGDPRSVKGSAWAGKAYDSGATGIAPSNNNYFSLASFRADDAGKYRRRRSQFEALHAVMLDDIGEKVDLERLTIAPTWMIETSPGNFQAGYIFSEPLVDGALADRLMNAIVAAHLCDPGANGPRARLARLPVAVNGKHEPAFKCRLVTWHPELVYTVDELVDGLQLDMSTSPRPKKAPGGRGTAESEDDQAVWTPRPEENAVIGTLRERGLYKSPLGSGKHDVTCPWVSQHTDSIDHGTAYFEPDDNWPIGGFKCLHGHCADRNVRDLLGALDVEIRAARHKPVIRVVGGELHRVSDAAERELTGVGRYYQRGGLIVTVVTDPGARDTRVIEVSQPALARALAGCATWEKYDGRTKDWVRIDPPTRHTSTLYDAAHYPHLSPLLGLARQPYLRDDGSLMFDAGYDEATGMFGIFDSRAFAVPAEPSREDAIAALELLQETIAEFSFASEHDRAAALTAILTATARSSLPAAPMFHVRAHMVGSGKSYLCELITAFATPQRGSPMSFPGDDEECRKLLLAELLRSPAVIEFDNLTSDLKAHKSLCTALTSGFVSGRILGVSKTAAVSTRTLFLSSGNNVGPVHDMARRCITIDLTPQCEIPAARTFQRPDLVREILHNRGRYVSAALTIIRAWVCAGRPRTECRALASYGDWSDTCRQPLLWLGCADPTASTFEAIQQDPDRELLGRLLDAWHSSFGDRPTMIRDAVKHSQSALYDEREELREAFHDIAGERGEVNRRRLGWWLKRHSGQIVEGKRLSKTPGNRSAEAWKVEIVESVSPVSSVSSGNLEKTVGYKLASDAE